MDKDPRMNPAAVDVTAKLSYVFGQFQCQVTYIRSMGNWYSVTFLGHEALEVWSYYQS